MKKPKPEVVERYDYHTCCEYVASKLGHPIDHSFWFFLCDVTDLHNGSMIYMPLPEDTEDTEIKAILKLFFEEFGDTQFWVEW